MGWKKADKIGVVLYNFKASGSHQLPVHVGDLVYILEELESREWYRGYLFYEPSKRGIFPASFVHIKESTSRKIGSRTMVVPAEDYLIVEATEGLRQWRWKLRDRYVHGPREQWRPLLHAMEEVVNYRRAILNSNATLEALQETKAKLSAAIDAINKQSGCPLTPRGQDGVAVDCHQTSVLDLWRLHQDRRADSTSDHAHPAHGTLRKQRQDQPHAHLHHLYMRVDAIDHIFVEDCEIFFFLSGAGQQQLSERYFFSMPKGGDNKQQERKSCVFTDLGTKDLETNVYLVCQIIRNGKMLMDKKHHSQHTFRRPYACGVLDVRRVLQAKEAADKPSDQHHKTMTMPLYLCGTNHDSNFATFHTTVIQKYGAEVGQKPGCAFTLYLRAFHRKQLSAVRREVPFLFTKTTTTAHKLGFPDVILPGDARNDIYVTLESGSFSKGTKTAERNVEVAINVVDRSGTVIPNAIVLGAGAGTTHEYVSFIYYHNNNPKWKETFKLAIPFEKVPDAHLRIVFRHLAKDESREKAEKSFSFAYMKVMKDDGSIIRDGPHELYVYETGNKRWSDPSVYLNQASSREEMAQSITTSQRSRTSKSLRGSSSPAQAARNFREVVTLSTLTCSTKLTQRIELLLLLKWRQKSRDLSVVLKNVVHVGGEEVVKFLQDTLDCLFEILNDSHEKYGELVFEALVAIFGLMADDRYHHFTTVLDIYIEKHFSALLAHKFLLASFKHNLKDLMLADRQHEKLIKILQSMPYLFKFIVQSSHLHQKHHQREDPVFRRDLEEVFEVTFKKLMAIPEGQLHGIHKVQKVVLEYFPAILPELVQIFSCGEIAVFLSGFMDSVLNMDMPVIPLHKLTCISAVLQSPVKLLDDEGARRKLVPTLVSHLISHMGHRMMRTQFKDNDRSNQEVVHCVGQLLGTLSDHQLNRSAEDVQFVVPLMHPLLRLCKYLPRQNKLFFPNMVNFLTLLALMTDDHYSKFFLSLQSYIENAFGEYIQDLMSVLHGYVSSPPYSHDWCTLYLLQNRVLGRTLTNCSKALLEYALKDTAFAPSVWDRFFGLCAQFLVQPCLELERLSDFRRHSFLQEFGDVRVSVGHLVASLWHKLGDKKGNFIPNNVKPFLEISLIKHEELRRVSLPVIMDIMLCEQRASGNFKRVEMEVFDKMDDLIASGRGDEEYRELFKDTLHPLCVSNNLGSTGEVFINSASHLIGLLLDYRNVSSEEGHKDRKMGCMLNLLNFYREIEKEELYIRYIYKLAELHKKDQSFTEAGFTLLLRAKGLEWTTEPVPPEGRFGEEMEQMKLKEELYKEVIELFDRGQAWEYGIPLCKELCTVYETEIKYTELAATLQREAEFFQKIVRELRVEPEYFMVGCYGKGFPLFLRNKVFIHRGLPYERLGSFIERLTEEYSTAELLKSTKPPEDEIKSSSGMYLQVRSVQAIPEEQNKFKGKTVPDSVSRYYKANDVCKFRYDRPFHRGEKRKDCEIATLWLERTNFVTTKSFPGEMAWFEVASLEEVELDPLDIAIETVSSKTAEVRVLTALHSENASLNINPLSMLLSGLIDAAVGGGIKNYRMVFFNTEYTASNPDHAERVKRLKQLIEEQLAVLRKGLDLHGRRIAHTLKGMQQNLEGRLEEMVFEVFPERRKKPVRSHTVKTVPLPPTPMEELSKQSQSQTIGRGRRLTGKLKNKVNPTPETTMSPPNALQRSATARAPSRDSPKQPSPYMQRRLSSQQSTETKRLSGSGSFEGSCISEKEEEEEEQDTYERVDEFILQRHMPMPAAPPMHTPMPAPPPTYTPPPPPGHRPDEVDDHEYTPVKVTDAGEVLVRPQQQEEVWDTLPLKHLSPQPKKRGTGFDTSSPQRTPARSLLGTSPSGRSLVAPPGTSPPLSLGRKLTPSTPHSVARGAQDLTDGPQEQPKLPPKKRKESKTLSDPQASKWHGSPPRIPAPAVQEKEPVYGFDTLTPPLPRKPAPEQPEEDVYNHLMVTPGKGNTPQSSPGSSHSPSPAAVPSGDSDYFSHLAKPLSDPKPRPPAPPTTDSEEVYFSRLVPPTPPRGMGDDDSLSDRLSASPTKPHAPIPPSDVPSPDAVPPPVPMKKSKPQRQTSTSDDAVTPTHEGARPIPRPRMESYHPVPVPRTTPSWESFTPSRPPKPGVPLLPPKPAPPKPVTKPVLPPGETDLQPPPRPAKNKPLT